jgi:hypothetical protein
VPKGLPRISEFDPVCGKPQPCFLVSLVTRLLSQLAALFRFAAEFLYIRFSHATGISLEKELFNSTFWGPANYETGVLWRHALPMTPLQCAVAARIS